MFVVTLPNPTTFVIPCRMNREERLPFGRRKSTCPGQKTHFVSASVAHSPEGKTLITSPGQLAEKPTGGPAVGGILSGIAGSVALLRHMRTIKMWAKIFPSRVNTPDDIVKALRESLQEGRDQDDPREVKKMREAVSKEIHVLKQMLFGDPSSNIDVKAQDVSELVRIACEDDLLMMLASNLSQMEFETRKDAVQIFNNILRQSDEENGGHCPREKVAENNGEILVKLVEGHSNDGGIALNCGAILRECIRRHENLAKLMFDSGLFWRFFKLVELSDFDVASDAFSTFKDCLTKHAGATARYLEGHKDRFVESYNTLLESDNYVTRRQSLKLLGEMLLERANFHIMKYYISSRVNLQVLMNLLLDNRKMIQFEAYHVFRIFVLNPHKSKEVEDILVRNKGKMLEYLKDFLTDREDEQFQEGRLLVVQEIESLPDTIVGEESSLTASSDRS